jgi:hypothetical protein
MMNLQRSDYDPDAFIDWLVRDIYDVKNDRALARKLEMTQSVISKIRHRKIPVGDSILIAVHEYSGMRTMDIKKRMFRKLVAPAI